LKNKSKKKIPTISTGEPSILATYRGIALVLSGNDKDSKAVKFFDDKIAEQGADEIVLASESQMLHLIKNLL